MPIAITMLLAYGTDRSLLDHVVHALGGEVRIADQPSFDLAMEARADTILCIESIVRAGGPPPVPVGSLAPLLGAAEAPPVSRVLVVTTRVDTDGDLRRVRRSGARYVIVRPPPIVDAEALRGKRVLVPRTVAERPLVLEDDAVRAIVDVLRDGSRMGETIDVPPSGLAALEAAGARPRVVAPWRAKLGRWFGEQVLSAPA